MTPGFSDIIDSLPRPSWKTKASPRYQADDYKFKFKFLSCVFYHNSEISSSLTFKEWKPRENHFSPRFICSLIQRPPMVLKSPQKSAGCRWFFTGAFLLRQQLHSGYGPFVCPRKLGLEPGSHEKAPQLWMYKGLQEFPTERNPLWQLPALKLTSRLSDT